MPVTCFTPTMTAERSAVWVTRTEPGASRLAERLESAGYRVLNEPLLVVEPVTDSALTAQLERGADAELGIAVSAHAVRLGLPRLRERRAKVLEERWLAVGTRTAEALARFDIRAEVPAVESSEGILSEEILGDVAGKRVLVLCGVGGRELLVDELGRRGAEVVRLEAYRRRAVALPEAVAARVRASVGVVLVASGEIGAPLALAVEEPMRADLAVIAGSERIAHSLRRRGFERLMVATGPDDESMLAALDEWRGR